MELENADDKREETLEQYREWINHPMTARLLNKLAGVRLTALFVLGTVATDDAKCEARIRIQAGRVLGIQDAERLMTREGLL